MHTTGYTAIEITVEETESGVDLTVDAAENGLMNDKTQEFASVTEALMEISNIDLIRNYWPQHEALRGFPPEEYVNVGYQPTLILLDELFKARFADPTKPLKVLQRGLLTGDKSTLQVIRDAVGDEIMQKLAWIREDNAVKDALEIADMLELSSVARDKIKRMDTKDILTWL